MSNASKRLRGSEFTPYQDKSNESSSEGSGQGRQRLVKSYPYQIPTDAEDEAYRKEQEEQHLKLRDFLKFKAQSKMLSRQFAADGDKETYVPPLDMTESEDEGSPGKKKVLVG